MNNPSEFYCRRLHHNRGDGVIYFVTWRLIDGEGLSPSERDLVAGELHHRHEQRYELYAYVVMNDHVHVLLRVLDEQPLEKIVHAWKSFTAHAMQRRHRRRKRVWQEDHFDRIVRDDTEFVQKLQYILGNPWSRWPDLKEYQWTWAKQ